MTNLVIIETLFYLTKTLSDQLQSPDLQLASAVDLVEAVMSSLIVMRNEESWENYGSVLQNCARLWELADNLRIRGKGQPHVTWTSLS